jgi:hypothetical protein
VAVDLQTRIGRRRRGAWQAIAVSLVFHAFVFLAVGLIVPRPTPHFLPDSPPVNITLLPPITQQRIHRARPQPTPATAPRASQPATRPLAIHAAKDIRPDAPPSPLAASAQPGPAAGANGSGTSHAPAPLPFEDSGRGVHAFLRGTVGCDYGEMAHLSAEEKARCADRFANIEKKAPEFSGIPGEKLGGFMAEAAANERRRTAHDQSVPMTLPITREGNLPPEAMHHFKY